MRLLILGAATFISGCANLSPLTASHTITANGSYWLTYDSSRRGTLLYVQDGKIVRTCAEPAPDTAYSFTNGLKGTFKTPGGTSAEGVDAQMTATALALAGRDNLVLLSRESLFRLCEARANGDITPTEYETIFIKILDQIEAIAAAEKARSEAVRSLQLRTMAQ